MQSKTRAVILIGLFVQAIRLAAGYSLLDGADAAGWIRELLGVVGALSAITVSGGTGILVFQRSRDPVVRGGILVLVGIATLLMTAAHLSLMHSVPMPEVLDSRFLTSELPSVVIALASALGVDLVIVLLARSSEGQTEDSAESCEREVQLELKSLHLEKQRGSATTPNDGELTPHGGAAVPDEVHVLECRFCRRWKTSKPTLQQAKQSLRGHWAHCRAKAKTQVAERPVG